MPSRRDGRIEPGQPLKSAISAAAWNRAQDAADAVLGQRPGVTAQGPLSHGLPRTTVALPTRGYFGQVAYYTYPSASGVTFTTPGSPPTHPDKTWAYSEHERIMRAVVERLVLSVQMSSATLSGSSGGGEPQLLICSDNDSHRWVVGGYAACRVRVFNPQHRHARMARTFPGSTEEQNSAASGCLDSSFYGPARIVGYFLVNEQGDGGFGFATESPFAYPSNQLRWALVVI